MAQTYDQTRELLARLWDALWPELRPAQQERVLALPEPCHNHLEVRLRRPERGQRLIAGCRRLAVFDTELLLEGLRLFPHAICRTAEAVGPLPDELWESLSVALAQHRLWRAQLLLASGDEGFWQTVEALERHRELPQPILDFVESGRSVSEAPMVEFSTSLRRFLVRAKLEKARFATYATIKAASP